MSLLVRASLYLFALSLLGVSLPFPNDIETSYYDKTAPGELFTVTRSDGTVLGPYKIRPFSHSEDQEKDFVDVGSSFLEDDSLLLLVDNGTVLNEEGSYISIISNGSSDLLNVPSNDLKESSDYFFLQRDNGEVLGPYQVRPFSHNSEEVASALNESLLAYTSSIEVGGERESHNIDAITERDIEESSSEEVDENVQDDTVLSVTSAREQLSSVASPSDTNSDFTNEDHIIHLKKANSTSSQESIKKDIKNVDMVSNNSAATSSPKIADLNNSPPEGHTDCTTQLDEMHLRIWPSENFFVEGEPLILECSLPTTLSSTVRVLWLFQAIDLPMPQCSLIKEETLNLCQHFPSVEHIVDTNVTGNIHEEILKLQGLTVNNTGYYMCLAEVICGKGNEAHTMNRLIKTDFPIIVYESGSYTAELAALAAVVIVLSCILILGLCCERKRRPNTQTPFTIPQSETTKKVLHVPLLVESDNDSFDSEREDA